MKSFQAIQEERGEKAFKQAIAMGLKYGGFGYWKDPQTGETKFKTENDTLIPVEPDESSELAGKGGPDSNGMADGQMGGGMMGGGGMGNMMGPGGMLQMPGQQPGSGILGAPEPGEETPEGGERKGWEPGPDGDTCAGPDAQDPADVPKDTYVGTTNYAKWVAGPDGDNMTTVSAASIQEVIEPEPIIEPTQSFETFIAEAPMAPMGGTDPKAEAEQLGLEFAGFGWYRDPKTGKRVAKVEGDQLIRYDNQPAGASLATTHTGNPTNPASGMTPASKARSMGLQSNGSGGYIDPSTGQVVAKTVNNELVFYDAQGGAISDGSGGEQLTQSAPSWVDPVSGLIIVPPAQPESPEEQAAVPDSTPAQAPMGLDAFFNKKKVDMYKQQAAQDAAQGDIDSQQAEMDAAYEKNEGMQQMYSFLQGAMEDAMESGDPDRIGAANAMQDLMARPDVQEDLFLLFDAAGPEGREELDGKVVDYLIKQSRSNHLGSELGSEEDYANGEDGRYDEMVKRGGTPGMDRAGEPNRYNLRNYDGVMDDFRGQIGMRDTNYKPVAQMLQDAVASAEERKGRNAAANAGIEVDSQNDLDYEMGQAAKDTGLVDQEVDRPYTSTGDSYDDNNNIEVDGEYVTYRMFDSEKVDQDFVQKNIVDKGLMDNAEHRFSPRLQKLNNFNGPQGAVTVDWDVKGDIDMDDPKMKKRVALDALKTWRQKILPELDPGTVVHNTPADEQRARIYTLAGFSDPNSTNDQFGLVIMDRDGQKKVVPLGDRTTRVTKMEESYMAMVNLDLNTDEMELVYEVLLG